MLTGCRVIVKLVAKEHQVRKLFYLEQEGEVELFKRCFELKSPLLLKGPTGCGKTRFVEAMAQKLERPLFTVSCQEETSATDLVGRHLLLGDETRFVDGPLTRAVRQGAILYLDELAEARPDVLVVIHSITDYRRKLFVERTGEEISAPEEFMLVASYNPGYQAGVKELKPSTKQRFVGCRLDYPEPHLEIRVIEHESGLELGECKPLVELAQRIRKLKELGLMETVSTRLLVETAKLIGAGVGPRKACLAAIIEPLTDDEEDKKVLQDLVSLHF